MPLKPSTRVVYDSWLKVVILPALGKRLVRDLDFQAIEKMHREEAKKHKISANRAITVLSAAIIAEKKGWRTGSNPCRQIEKPGGNSRSRTFTADELAALETAISALCKPRAGPQAGDLFRFLGLERACARAKRWGAAAFADVDCGAPHHALRGTQDFGQEGCEMVLPLNSYLKVIIPAAG